MIELFNLHDRGWIGLGAAAYLAGFLVGVVSLLRHRRHSRGLMYGFLGLGFFLQTTGLYLRGVQVRGCPLGNEFEIVQFVAWSLVVVYLAVGPGFRVSLLGFFSAGLAGLFAMGSLLLPDLDVARRSAAPESNPLIEFHAALALFSYGVFALLALTSLMYLLQTHSLRRHKMEGWFRFLPSLSELEQVNFRLLLMGAVLLSSALLVGAFYWIPNPEVVHRGKIGITTAIWVFALVILYLRFRGRLLAGRLAWSCVALFAAALISLGPVNASRYAEAFPPLPAPETVEP